MGLGHCDISRLSMLTFEDYCKLHSVDISYHGQFHLFIQSLIKKNRQNALTQ